LLNEIKRYLPNLHTQLDKLSKNTIEVKGPYPFKELNNSGKKVFKSLQPVSIDHGIMEKSSNSVVFPTNIGWNDVGSWTALADISQKDSNGNVIKGNVLSIENKNSIIYAEERLVATMGLKNMIVVDTSDALLICPKDCAQDVKKIVEQIKLEKRPEVSIATNSEIRPWGNFVILQKEANYLVKRIEVLPGESLSLQSHNHRSEHWTIVAGTAQVQINKLSKILQTNQSIEIPKRAKHRLANHSQSPLIIIEVQLGENLNESDIIRYEDKYERT
jgi:mannose-1-phosphate guanylyltransferase/mannose-6-phosphate isomerase